MLLRKHGQYSYLLIEEKIQNLYNFCENFIKI